MLNIFMKKPFLALYFYNCSLCSPEALHDCNSRLLVKYSWQCRWQPNLALLTFFTRTDLNKFFLSLPLHSAWPHITEQYCANCCESTVATHYQVTLALYGKYRNTLAVPRSRGCLRSILDYRSLVLAYLIVKYKFGLAFL